MSVRWEAVKAARPPAWPCSSAPPPDPSVHADADAAGPAASSDFLLPGVRGPHCCRLPRPATCRPPRRTRTWERAARSLLSCVASARGRVCGRFASLCCSLFPPRRWCWWVALLGGLGLGEGGRSESVNAPCTAPTFHHRSSPAVAAAATTRTVARTTRLRTRQLL